MQRTLKAEKPIGIKPPGASRAHEQEFAELLEYMTDQFAQRWRNQVLGGLHVDTVGKFADAQVGNYATVYMKLANQVRRKLLKQFDDGRIELLVRTILDKVNKRNRSELYKLVEKRIGLSSVELTQTEGLTADINALVIETQQWVKKTRDDTLDFFTNNSLRAMTQGDSLESVMKQFDGVVETRKSHASYIARNQIRNFTSITTKVRAQNLGITTARWVTSRDERVRRCHQVRDGKEFDLSKGLYSSCDGKWMLPGTDHNCRCDYELIIPAED
jgi:SPP1 gp7 family putative phage head morphogenesis protein